MESNQKIKAVILLSGGLDSTVALAIALRANRECLALSFDYGQRHRIELKSAKAICEYYNVAQRFITIDPTIFGSSALVSNSEVAKNRSIDQIFDGGVPSTYVPARNTIFLSYALGYAELIDAQEIYYGPNATDRAGYSDCRPAYIQAFQGLMNLATKQAIEGNPPKLMTPLVNWDKSEIIKQGQALNVPLQLTMSCYDPSVNGDVCQACDACILRAKGFELAKVSIKD